MLTLIEQVSSVSKSTIDFPPCSSSVLLGGRKRATTALTDQQLDSMECFFSDPVNL